MNSRVKELDFLKCIFIILMIIFHLVYIGDSYPYAKQVVYTFHMSAFLVISGYLNNVNKEIKVFGQVCFGYSFLMFVWKPDTSSCQPFSP